MNFRRETDEAGAGEVVARFLDALSDVYAQGVSEEITGRVLEDVRPYRSIRNARRV